LSLSAGEGIHVPSGDEEGEMTSEELNDEVGLILRALGEVYKNAHDIATRTNHPLALEILKLCSQMAEQYEALERSLRGGLRNER
jgi:hypothetical protein